MKRIAVPISGALLVEALTEGQVWSGLRVTRGIPHDAVCVGVAYDPVADVARVCFEHASFEEVAEGDRVPDRHVLVSRDASDWGLGEQAGTLGP